MQDALSKSPLDTRLCNDIEVSYLLFTQTI